MKHLKLYEDYSDKNELKELLFEILRASDYVQKFDYIWSPNLAVGADIMYVKGLSEKEFFDPPKSVYKLNSHLWPYGEADYEEWKHLYYGLAYGYKIKDKRSNVNILVQVIRFEKTILPMGTSEFEVYINPNFVGKGDSKGEKFFINDKMISVSGIQDPIDTRNSFSDLGKSLAQKAQTIPDVKLLFNYLDALI